MLRKTLWAIAVIVCLFVSSFVVAQGDYLDVYIGKIKPERMADARAITKKMVDANHRFGGDTWIAMESMYGEGDTIVFVSTRQDYSGIDKGNEAFVTALNKAYGQDGAAKLLNDWESCLRASRNELRKRRWDLSRKAPDPASYGKFVGESRLLRTTAVHIRPGRVADFEALLKDTKMAGEQNANTQPLLVSQVVEGGVGTIFYISSLRSSMSGFDKNPSIREILGEEGYKRFLQISADTIEGSESTVYRFSAELSNPPEEIRAAASDFWSPKPIVARSIKPKGVVEQAAEKQKQQ